MPGTDCSTPYPVPTYLILTPAQRPAAQRWMCPALRVPVLPTTLATRRPQCLPLCAHLNLQVGSGMVGLACHPGSRALDRGSNHLAHWPCETKPDSGGSNPSQKCLLSFLAARVMEKGIMQNSILELGSEIYGSFFFLLSLLPYLSSPSFFLFLLPLPLPLPLL